MEHLLPDEMYKIYFTKKGLRKKRMKYVDEYVNPKYMDWDILITKYIKKCPNRSPLPF